MPPRGGRYRSPTEKIWGEHGAPLYMMIYGMILYVLMDQIRGENHGFIQSWYAHDFSTSGEGDHIKPDIYQI